MVGFEGGSGTVAVQTGLLARDVNWCPQAPATFETGYNHPGYGKAALAVLQVHIFRSVVSHRRRSYTRSTIRCPSRVNTVTGQVLADRSNQNLNRSSQLLWSCQLQTNCPMQLNTEA